VRNREKVNEGYRFSRTPTRDFAETLGSQASAPTVPGMAYSGQGPSSRRFHRPAYSRDCCRCRPAHVYLVLAFAAAPLVHAALFYGLGWDEYMPFLKLPR
jgi:hypothetical protein